MVFECCVKGCETIAKNGLHSFPSNKLAAQKWIEAIKALNLMDRLNTNSLSHSYKKVCKRHFKDSDFQLNGKGQLVVKVNSIPSLFLPNDTDQLMPPKPLKPVKRLQQRHYTSINDASKQSKYRPTSEKNNDVDVDGLVSVNIIGMGTLENDSDVDVIGLDSANEIEMGSKTVADLNNCSTNRGKVTKIMNGSNQSYKPNYYQKTAKQQKPKRNKINDTVVLNYLGKKFNRQLFEFFKMQLTNCQRPKHGRRYTPEQKSLCLAMYKQGPKSYRFKEKWCALPVKSTLGRYSANLIFKSGVDTKVLEAMKNIVKDWPKKDTYCSISWDEVSLKAHLDYCQSQDYIEGFIELNKSRQPIFATHALTFMVRGITLSFKQAMAYFYTNGLNTFELVELVKLMIEAASTTGLNPILSMCDQVSTNASAVNTLVNPACPSRQQSGGLLLYKVKGHRIVHCFDPSHLIKTARNNFEKKNLAHFITKRWQVGDKESIGSLQIAAWDDLYELYRMDTQSTQRRLPKLTDEHLKPKELKMKVSLATQIFSNTCGTVMLQGIQQDKLPEHFTSTAQLLFFMNDLFDSMNGSEHQLGDTLKSAVTANSIHFEFWDYALSILQKMFFVDKMTGDINNRSSVLKKMESTIRGFKEFSKMCFSLNIAKVSISLE